MARSVEAVRDQLTPALKIIRTAKVDCMVLQSFPTDQQAIPAGEFDGARQFHREAAFRALEQRLGSGYAFFEFRLHPGLDGDLRNFENHDLTFATKIRWILSAGER